ncbi:MAG: hypothetical protein KGJ43_08775, partial [Acidobacteriota bacterium]|nr:hypothetical protein [Acidobacteriota bacterium]
ADVLLNCPWEAASMAVGDLLTSQRRWGQTRSRKLLAQIPVTERKTIGSMTERQRCTLAGLLSAASRGGAPRAAELEPSSAYHFSGGLQTQPRREPKLLTA